MELAKPYPPRAVVAGCMVDRLDMAGTLARCEELIAAPGVAQHVAINAAKVVAMQDDAALRAIVEDCELVSADGQSVVWASRILGDPLPTRVAGIDLMHELLALSERKGYRVYVLGAKEAVLERAVERVLVRHPGLELAGARHGYFADDEGAVVAEEIREASPDILFVAISSPKKEYWLSRYGRRIDVPFVMGVGGSVDVLAGVTRRAPRVLQRAGLEWAYRFAQEPRRLLRRYVVTNVRFAILVLRHLSARRPRSARRACMTDRIAEAARELCRVAAASDWTGPDIYDALGARWPGFLTGGRRRRQALIQLHARSPIDLRPLSRRTHAPIAKAAAVFAMADLRLAELGDATAHHAAATGALDQIDADRSAGEAAWGYPWEVQTRWSHYPAGTPNVIVTAFSARALLRGAAALGEPRYEARARAAARWVHERLYLDDLGAYAYHPGSRAVIHNANLLGARTAWAVRDEDASIVGAVGASVERTLAAQAPDGSFAYGEGPGLEFVDSFHTGYVIACLCDLREVDPAVAPALERAAAFYADRFFDARGRATLWGSRPFPEDAHSAGTGLSTVARLLEVGIGDPELLDRVGERATEAMVRSGHAVHRRHRWGATRVRYVRWADSHLALGLADAAAVRASRRVAST